MLLSWLVTLIVPIALIGLGLRVLLSPLFLQIEYNMPYLLSTLLPRSVNLLNHERRGRRV